MQLGIADLFASPDHYLFMFDGDQAVFRPMNRDAYGRSIFLDDRIQPAGQGAMRVPIAPLLDHAREDGAARNIGWIFHVAHCGSTLLARALDDLAGNIVLREPASLRQLALEGANAFAGRDAAPEWREGLSLATRMMGKSYSPGQPVLIKANVPVNFILHELMALMPDAKAILLHFGWEDYLGAILRSPDHRRWLRHVTAEVAPALIAEVGPVAKLDDGELAAALWLAQMRIYARALERWPQLRSLDAEGLFADPHHVVAQAAAFFGLDGASADARMASLAGSYAKNPVVPFDNAARLARRAAGRDALRPELDRARAWLVDHGPIPGELARAL